MDEEAGLTDCSISSIFPRCSSEDLLENAENIETAPIIDELEKTGRKRKLLDKLQRGEKFNLQPKLGNFPANIDLSTPDERVDGFADRFPQLANRSSKYNHREPVKSVSGVIAQKRIKGQISAKLAERRKAEQEKRRALYAEDNEDLLMNDTDDDEEKEVDYRGSASRMNLKNPKPVNSDCSEDDDDYKEYNDEADTDGHSSESDHECENDDDEEDGKLDADECISQDILKNSEDIFSSQSPLKPLSDPPLTADFHDKTINPDCESSTQFPASLSQWWNGSQSTTASQWKDSFKFEDNQLVEEIGINNAVTGNDDLLLLSGQFDIPHVPLTPKPLIGINNTVNGNDDLLLLSGQFDIPPEQPEAVAATPEEDDIILPTRSKSSKKLAVYSDDEDDDGDEKTDLHAETNSGINTDTKELSEDVATSSQNGHNSDNTGRRAVIVSDDEDADVGEDMPEDNFDNNGSSEEDSDQEDDQHEEDLGSGGSDDELAVFRRLERQEYKKKIKLDTFVDEEADLSGDDVGSDLDDDGEENNEYEADECDKEVYDTDELRQKNHKLFLKQEHQEVHRDIAKLQDRLLADGDLAGVETNRSFRVKLRTDEAEVDLDTLREFSQEAATEEDDQEDDKNRSEAIKFKVEMHNILSQESSDPFDDELEHAASAALQSKATIFETRVAPTLLGKAPLVNVIKDIAGSTAVKQLYTSTSDSIAGVKRPSQFAGNVAKKNKLNLLDSLNE